MDNDNLESSTYGRRRYDGMSPEEVTKSIYKLQAEMVEVQKGLERLDEKTDKVSEKIDGLIAKISEAQNYCTKTCTGLFVSDETFKEAVGPLKKLVYGVIVALIAGFTLAVMTARMGLK